MNERIKELRNYLGLTLEKFGEPIGIKKSGLSLIENGKNALTEQNIKVICRTYNVNEEWLRTGEGEMFNKLDQENELMQWAGKLLGSTDSFKKNFVRVLMSLDEKEWEFLERKAKELANYCDNEKKG